MAERWGRSGTPRLKKLTVWKLEIHKKFLRLGVPKKHQRLATGRLYIIILTRCMAIRNLLILFATFSKAAKIIKNRKFSYYGFWLQVSVSDSVEMKKAGISDHRIWLQVSVMA